MLISYLPYPYLSNPSDLALYPIYIHHYHYYSIQTYMYSILTTIKELEPAQIHSFLTSYQYTHFISILVFI